VTFLHWPSLASLPPTAYTDFAAPTHRGMFLTILRDFGGGEGMSSTATQSDSSHLRPQFDRFSGFILISKDQFIP